MDPQAADLVLKELDTTLKALKSHPSQAGKCFTHLHILQNPCTLLRQESVLHTYVLYKTHAVGQGNHRLTF